MSFEFVPYRDCKSTKAYDGFNLAFNAIGFTTSMYLSLNERGWTRVDVFIDKKNLAVQIKNVEDGLYKLNRTIPCRLGTMGFPKGRYLLAEDTPEAVTFIREEKTDA
jgi:hypothetical protein